VGSYLNSEKLFSSSAEVFSWLSKFINLERGQTPKSFRIDRMEFLTQLAGNPHKRIPSIHIAGSKGKGSVTGMSAAMLTAAGFRAARYMSPHIVDIRERICLGNSYFDEEVYCAAGNELKDITENLPAAANPLFDPAAADGCEPTFFELLTLFFFLCAKHGNCDVIVAETGMGGRLDSTNVLDPQVSVITLIELEHTGFLGDTIAKIAAEKAGIIKNSRPLVLAKQREEALEVFKKTANEKNSELFYFPETTEISNVKVTPAGTDFTLSFKTENRSSAHQPLFSAPLSLSIPVPGKVQAENAALAIAAVKTAFPQIDENAVRAGLKNLKIPARFEKICESPPFIIDGAHTPESLALAIETFCSLFGEGGILVFGCAADKDAAAMAKIAYSHFTKIIITTPGTFKISNPPKVYEAFAAQATAPAAATVPVAREKTQLITDTQEAVRAAQEFAAGKNLPVLGTGSFYLVSEIRKIILP
jgi:dihydrofolate synthase/folylpolyglutamate synthase